MSGAVIIIITPPPGDDGKSANKVESWTVDEKAAEKVRKTVEKAEGAK